MDSTTRQRLNQINREFYRLTAEDFDQSRSQPWPGWDILLPYLRTPLTVLDVGCGNGRFGVFLYQNLGTNLTYYGIDSNLVLLERARIALSGVEACLELRDILEDPLSPGEFTFVALFGVLHHIPGLEQRQLFMRELARRVAPGGHLAFAAWRFYDFERFRERVVPWSKDVQVERHDYLLDWRRGTPGLRYCHFVDDTEHATLVAATGLTEILSFRADGQSNDVNRYSLLRRETL
jgi:tRNA (uracil-5-)-methyltransferase TRM9